MATIKFDADISAALLFLISALCLWGLLSRHYRENWLQFVGLVGVMFWAFGRGFDMLERDTLGAHQFASHVSLALYALGTAWKVWRHRGSHDRDDDGARP